MPTTGFPDKEIHRFCVRCKRWHMPDDGIDYVLPRVHSGVTAVGHVVAGTRQSIQFMCSRCVRARRRNRTAAVVVLAVLLLAALTLRWFMGA